MTDPGVQPALSKEDWAEESFCEADGESEGAISACVDIAPCADVPVPVLTVEILEAGIFERDCPDEHLSWTLLARVDMTRRHALAALALRGQPFGFRQEDVKYLLDLAEVCEHESGEDWQEDGPKLRNLAARIAALLPPSDERSEPVE